MSFKEKMLHTLSTRVFLLVSGLVTSIIYARLLGPHGFGQGILLLLFPPILIKFMNLGISNSLTYLVGQNPEEKAKYLGTAFTFAIVLSTVSTGLLLLLEEWIFSKFYDSNVPRDLLHIVFLCTPLNVGLFYYRASLKALNKIKEYNLLIDVIPTILRFILTLFFMLELKLGVEGYIYQDILVTLASVILIGFELKRSKTLLPSWDHDAFKEMLHYGLRAYLNNITGALSSKIDQLLIGAFLTPTHAGIYAVAQNLSSKLLIVSRAIGLVMVPELSRRTKDLAIELANKILDKILLPMAIAIFASLGFMPVFTYFAYGEDYLPAYLPFIFLAFSTEFISLNKILSGFFVGTGRPEIKAIQRLVALGIRGILLLAFLPIYAATGCGMAVCFSELAVFVGAYYHYKKSLKLQGQTVFYFNIKSMVVELKQTLKRS